jgi:YD repeat-containing protein
MGLAFPDRNPFLDMMSSALQAFNSPLDGIVVYVGTVTSTYTYASTGYANPDAVTQIADGLGTTTYAYDNNGNLISAGTGTATTTYTYDYANRLIALFAASATTTYGDDAFGTHVIQTGTTTHNAAASSMAKRMTLAGASQRNARTAAFDDGRTSPQPLTITYKVRIDPSLKLSKLHHRRKLVPPRVGECHAIKDPFGQLHRQTQKSPFPIQFDNCGRQYAFVPGCRCGANTCFQAVIFRRRQKPDFLDKQYRTALLIAFQARN